MKKNVSATLLIAVAIFTACGGRAWGQVDWGTGVGPDAFGLGEKAPKKNLPPPIPPLALAASLALDASTWQTLQVSSEPARDLAELLRRGYYRLELLQMLVIARQSGSPLKTLVAERDKGDRLRAVAGRRHLDYDAVYDASVRLDLEVEDRWLPSIMNISVSTAPPRGEGPPARRRPRRG